MVFAASDGFGVDDVLCGFETLYFGFIFVTLFFFPVVKGDKKNFFFFFSS